MATFNVVLPTRHAAEFTDGSSRDFSTPNSIAAVTSKFVEYMIEIMVVEFSADITVVDGKLAAKVTHQGLQPWDGHATLIDRTIKQYSDQIAAIPATKLERCHINSNPAAMDMVFDLAD